MSKKEWQSAIENLDKKLIDMMKELKDTKLELIKEVKEVTQTVKSELSEVKKGVETISSELQGTQQRVKTVEDAMENLIDTQQTEMRLVKGRMSVAETKHMEKQLRFRGLPEVEGKSAQEQMTEVLADYLGKEEEEIVAILDVAYRVNSRIATQRKLPRDVIVQFTTRNMKERIVTKQFQDPLEIDGKTIIIMKELPRSVLLDRKKYRVLIQTLKDMNIRYRWELPEGVSFEFGGAKKRIRSEREMERFIKDNEKDLPTKP